MQTKQHYLILFICFWLSQNLFSQATSCPTTTPPGETCFDACVYCDINGFQGSNANFQANDAPSCNGNITFENDLWMGFVAGTSSISLRINTSNCVFGNGMQMAIYDACASEALACNVGSLGGDAVPLEITYNGFVPGQIYYLMLDGNLGDICNFTVEVLSGSTVAPELGSLGDIFGPTEFCTGGTTNYFVEPVAGASQYTWVAPEGVKINGMESPVTISGPNGAGVEVTFGNQGGFICVSASNPCKDPIESCIDVAISRIHTVLDPITVSADSLPYCWLNCFQVITEIGTFNLKANLVGINGCDSLVTQSITVQQSCPITVEISGNTEIPCNAGFTALTATANADGAYYVWFLPNGNEYEGNTLDVSEEGTYIAFVIHPSGECNASDTVVVTPAPLPIAHAGENQTLTCTDNFVTLDGSASSSGTEFTYLWNGPGITPLNQTVQSPSVCLKGLYTLMVTNQITGCTASNFMKVITSGTLPIADAGLDQVITCKTDTVILSGKGSSGPAGYTFQWSPQTVTFPTRRVTKTWAPGIYYLTVRQTSTGCKKTDLVIVEDGRIYAEAYAGPDTIITCATSNAGINLDATGSNVNPFAPLTYLWSGPSIDQSNRKSPTPLIFVPGTYTVSVTNGTSGCVSTAQVNVAADSGLPVANAGSDKILPTGGIAVLDGGGSSSGANFTYLWTGPGINPMNKNVQNPTVTVAGNYTLKVTNTITNCVAKDRVRVFAGSNLNNDASDREEEMDADLNVLSLAPNPANEQVTISFETPTNATIHLMDRFGRVLQRGVPQENVEQITVQVRNLPAGLYFLQVEMAEGTQVLKFIKA